MARRGTGPRTGGVLRRDHGPGRDHPADPAAPARRRPARVPGAARGPRRRRRGPRGRRHRAPRADRRGVRAPANGGRPPGGPPRDEDHPRGAGRSGRRRGADGRRRPPEGPRARRRRGVHRHRRHPRPNRARHRVGARRAAAEPVPAGRGPVRRRGRRPVLRDHRGPGPRGPAAGRRRGCRDDLAPGHGRAARLANAAHVPSHRPGTRADAPGRRASDALERRAGGDRRDRLRPACGDVGRRPRPVPGRSGDGLGVDRRAGRGRDHRLAARPPDLRRRVAHDGGADPGDRQRQRPGRLGGLHLDEARGRVHRRRRAVATHCAIAAGRARGCLVRRRGHGVGRVRTPGQQRAGDRQDRRGPRGRASRRVRRDRRPRRQRRHDARPVVDPGRRTGRPARDDGRRPGVRELGRRDPPPGLLRLAPTSSASASTVAWASTGPATSR